MSVVVNELMFLKKPNSLNLVNQVKKGIINAPFLPGVWVLGEGRKAAGVHVSSDVDVHGGVRLGQLSRQRDPLSGQGRDRGPGQRQP